ILCRGQLRAPDVRRAVDDLALQIAEVDHVVVDETDGAHTGGGEIHRGRRTQSAGADEQNLAGLEAALPVEAHFRHDQMPAVALDFVVGELRKRFSCCRHDYPPATDGMMLTVSPGDTGVCSFCR